MRPECDLLDPRFYVEDPHPAFTWMRANEPVYRDRINDLWAVSRHADIHDVERRAETFSSGRGYRSLFAPGETNMIAQDDPRHHDQRSLISRRFTPKAVHGHEEWLRATIATLVDGMVEQQADAAGGVEVIDALAAQLPCRLTARLLGWPEEQWPNIKSWSERLMRYDAMERDIDAATGIATAIMEFSSELGPMIEERKACPVDDLVSVWANADLDGEPLPFETMMHETGLVISGGAETTRTVIARGLRAFCDHGDQWELLHREPDRIPAAVEEMIRWVTPLNNFFRTASTDSRIGEVPVSAGDRVILLYPSANRDEAVFDDPFRFDITRSPNPHIGFGFGTHFCLGASLARFELGLVLEELVGRIRDLTVVDDTVDEPNIFATSVQRFELGFSSRR